MLKVEYVRDRKNQIIGSNSSGFGNGDTVARDRDRNIFGHSSSKFSNTRNSNGRRTSTNPDDTDTLLEW